MNKKIGLLKIPFSLLISFLCISAICPAQEYYLFIGTYTNSGSKGIYVYNFNAKTGKLKWVSNTGSSANPSFLAISNNGKNVYAVNETGGKNPGGVSAYSFNKKKGTLNFINSTFTGGDGPCYLSVSPNDNWLAVANYSGGSAAMFPLNADGSIKPYTQLIDDSIYKTNGEKARPHVHATVFSPDGNYLYTPDLGLDKVMIYEFKPENQVPLNLASPSFASFEKGSGPRHMVFHPNKRFGYLITETKDTVIGYQYENGQLTQIQEITAFPEGFSGKKEGSEIVVSPDGNFLYVSNRGDLNSITIYSINTVTGKLTFVGYQPAFGMNPRNFIIDPTGNFLLVANMNSNNIVIFKRDKRTGLLSKTNNGTNLPKPACLVMMP